MLTPDRLLRLATEMIIAVLGAILLWMALTRRFLPDRHTKGWMIASGLLVVWGLLNYFRARTSRWRAVDRLGGISLALVGALMVAISRAPFAWVLPLFAAIGGLLVLRGLAGSVIVSRQG